MAQGVGGPVGALDRLVARLVDSDVPLRRADLLAEARRIVPQEAPLSAPGLQFEVKTEVFGVRNADADIFSVTVTATDNAGGR